MEREVAFERIVQLMGCKWSVRILGCLRQGPARPSQLVRDVEGLPARVMHRCLARMEKDGLLEKTVYATVPPHTEYALTADGRDFVELLDAAKDMAKRWNGTQPPVRLRA